MGFFIANPLAALLVSLLFTRLAVMKKNRVAWVCAGAWALYTVYEHLMKTRVLCSGECNIRIDLLLIYPALLALSVWAVVQAFRKSTKDVEEEQDTPEEAEK